jgi:hypothetical protein
MKKEQTTNKNMRDVGGTSLKSRENGKIERKGKNE